MRVLSLLCLTLALFACGAKEETGAVSRRTSWSDAQAYVPREYIVTAASNVDVETVGRVYAAFGIENVHSLGGGRYVLRLTRDPGIDRIRSLAVESGQIEAVQRNFIYRTQ